MSKEAKRPEGPPQLIKNLLWLQPPNGEGAPTQTALQNLEITLKNPAEVLLGYDWLLALERANSLARAEEQLDQDLFEQTKRSDLTTHEALLLIKVMRERERRTVAVARRAIEIEQERRFRGL